MLGGPLDPAADEGIGPILAEAEAFLHQGTLYLALERLREAARLAPGDYRLYKVRGDVLMSFRRNEEAVAAYREAAARAPDALDVQWALWALLDRMGAQRQAIESLQEIVRLDPDNPLAHLRLARALSQADRLEDAALSYRRAVELEPDHPALRLQLARALFDILDYPGSRREVDRVLTRTRQGEPEWAAAQDLLALLRGESYDRGRRWDQSQTLRKLPWYSSRNLKEAVLTRGQAWRLIEQGRYREAEPVLQKALTLNPEDHRAWYDLGLTRMELGRYEAAIEAFETGIKLTKFAEFYPDSVFQIGRCLAKLGRWREAIARYERVLAIRDWRHEDFYALNFPDLAKVQAALEEARLHIQADLGTHEASEVVVQGERLGPEPYEYPLPPLRNGHKYVEPLPTLDELTPIGTDTVHGAFRQLITARTVIQDDVQTGLHEFIPVNPTDTFQQQDPEVYLVFTLTSNQEDLEVKVTSRWVAEQVRGLAPGTLVGTDTILLGLNERSGYFRLVRPQGGWSPGLYRVDLYLGPQVSAYTHIADLRFRIVADPRPR
ncbi:tetratricopeptide repeat protein [Nitrospira sp. Kam-Ns4a]